MKMISSALEDGIKLDLLGDCEKTLGVVGKKDSWEVVDNSDPCQLDKS